MFGSLEVKCEEIKGGSKLLPSTSYCCKTEKTDFITKTVWPCESHHLKRSDLCSWLQPLLKKIITFASFCNYWLTFMFFLWSNGFLHLFGGFHEKRKDGPQAQDVHKFMAVICSLWSNHCMVQDFQSTGARHFLFSTGEKRERGKKEQSRYGISRTALLK